MKAPFAASRSGQPRRAMVERVVPCAINERRRLFKDADELFDWLDGTLTEPERQAVKRWAGSQ
jgi:hypothetical protein